MTLWERVVQANRPGPPEHSVPFRVASAVAVLVGVGACWSQGELSPTVAAVRRGGHRGRQRLLLPAPGAGPWPAVKPILAVCAVGGFVWFILTVTHNATPGDISTVESPLAVLFAWVLSTHAFDVPARRDVAYSLAGSAALMAVAAAQSVDLSLGVYVRRLGRLRGLGPGGHVAVDVGHRWRTVAVAAGAPAALLAVVAASSWPCCRPRRSPPRSSSPRRRRQLLTGRHSRPTSPTGARCPPTPPAPAVGPGSADSSASPSPSTPASGLAGRPGGHAGAGHAAELLGRPDVRHMERPELGPVGQPGHGPRAEQAHRRLTFNIPPAGPGRRPGHRRPTDVQTFYLAQSGPNLVFHADNVQRVYLQSRSVFLTADGTIVSATSMGRGTIYTVVSDDNTATAAQLRRHRCGRRLPDRTAP